MLELAKGKDTSRGYETITLPFLFHFGDLGEVDGELEVSIFKFTKGSEGFAVRSVKFWHPFVMPDNKRFEEIFNDTTTQSHRDLKKRLRNMGALNGSTSHSFG